MTAPPVTVFVVDDDPAQVLWLGEILRTGGHRVETFEHGEALLARLTPADRGCVVLDLRMPGLGGLELQSALGARGVELPIVFVSGRADVPSAVAAMRGGAVDFLSKPVSRSELCAVVERALARDAAAARERDARHAARARWESLSARERDVCRLFAKGMLIKQVAAILGLGASTVQEHRAQALRKLQVSGAAELAELLARVEGG